VITRGTCLAVRRVVCLALVWTSALVGAPSLRAQDPWSTKLTATLSPVPIGGCGAVWIAIVDSTARDAPRNPQGWRVSMADFDMSVQSVDPRALVGKYNGAASFSVCACQAATVGAGATITASYPAHALAQKARVPGVAYSVSIPIAAGKAIGTSEPQGCPATVNTGIAMAPMTAQPFGVVPAGGMVATSGVGGAGGAAGSAAGSASGGAAASGAGAGAPAAGGAAAAGGSSVASAASGSAAAGGAASGGASPLTGAAAGGAPAAGGGALAGGSAGAVGGTAGGSAGATVGSAAGPASGAAAAGGAAAGSAAGVATNAGGAAGAAVGTTSPATSAGRTPAGALPATGAPGAKTLPIGAAPIASIVPSNVTNFVAVQTGENEVTLSWDALPNVSSFQIWGAGQPNTGVQQPGSATRVVLSNIPLGPQSWTIGSFFPPGNASTVGSAFPTTSLTLTSACSRSSVSPGTATSIVHVVPGTVRGAALTWPVVPQAWAYIVERRATIPANGIWTRVGSTCGGAPAAVIVSGSTTTGSVAAGTGAVYDSTGTVPGMTYTYQVKAIDGNGRMGWNTATWTAPKPVLRLDSMLVQGSTFALRAAALAQAQSTVRPPDFIQVKTTYGYDSGQQRWGTGQLRPIVLRSVPASTFAVTIIVSWASSMNGSPVTESLALGKIYTIAP